MARGFGRSMNKDYIKNVILFLEENEQYGDDWSLEIEELKKLINEIH